jgi:hypothetical protein
MREKPWQAVWIAAGLGQLIAFLWKHELAHEALWTGKVEGHAAIQGRAHEELCPGWLRQSTIPSV